MTSGRLIDKATNEIDWTQAYASGNNFICYYNDANGTDGYQISKTAGLFIVMRGYTIVLAFYGSNRGVYIGVNQLTSIADLEKVA